MMTPIASYLKIMKLKNKDEEKVNKKCKNMRKQCKKS